MKSHAEAIAILTGKRAPAVPAKGKRAKKRVKPVEYVAFVSTSHSVQIPVMTISEANQREHWGRKHARKKRQQSTIRLCLSRVRAPALPCTVTITRIAPGTKEDADNNVAAIKHAQDSLKTWLGADDGDPRITWVYAPQEQDGQRYGIRISWSSP